MTTGRLTRPRITYIGGPTALLEWRDLRLLTDPTFDPAGTIYPAGAYSLRKTQAPAVRHEALGRLDAVLLSHDHHFDNLDHTGRALLSQVDQVLTTSAGASRLGHAATGLAPWQEIDLRGPQGGGVLRVTATPARHGPPHADRGPVIGFVLGFRDDPVTKLYLSGDTVWYEGVREVAVRFPVRAALLFMGAARIPAVGPWHLTFTGAEGVEAAHAFSGSSIAPLHFEGWEHLSESYADIDRAFAATGLEHRLRWLTAGVPVEV